MKMAAPRQYMRKDRSRFPALRACRCPARPTLLGWKSVVTPKGRRTGAAVSATPTSCMHQSAGLHGYLQHLRQAGQRVKHAHALRRALHLQRTHASPQPHQRHESGGSSAAAAATHCSPRPGLGEPLHSNEPSAGGALSFRIARPARCGARDAAIGSPPLLSTLLL